MRLGQQVIELPLRGALASAPAAHVGLDERAAQHEGRADRVAEAERLGEEREGGGERARLAQGVMAVTLALTLAVLLALTLALTLAVALTLETGIGPCAGW